MTHRLSTDTVEPVGAPEPPSPLPSGTLLAGRYRLGEILGRGGFAIVYRALDEERGTEVALKLLRADRLNAATRKRFEREAAVAATLDHPHLVKVFGLGSEGDLLFLTMELVAGESLRERLAHGALPVDDAVRIAREVLTGLDALHGRGILHRDVKPGNILLDRDGRARLSDFGLVRSLGDDETRATSTNTLVGTIEYLSPEQALGKELDGRSDLYSLGVVLFEMLAGRPVHEGGSTLGTLLARLRESAPDLRTLRPEVPFWLAGVAAKLLATARDARYASATAALADLDRRRAPGSARRRRALQIAGAGLVLVTAASALLGWQAHTRSRFARVIDDGHHNVLALDRAGRELWRRERVLPTTANFVPVRLTSGGPPRLAALLYDTTEPSAGLRDRLELLDPQSGRIVRSVLLPNARALFGGFSATFDGNIIARDLDGDGTDEILVANLHTPLYPSYTVLWEPALDRARVVFAGSGHHYPAGYADLDADGKLELLFLGVNNRLGYSRALAAIRLEPAVGLEASVDPNSRGPATSPDIEEGERRSILWYSILPTGADSLSVSAAEGRVEILLSDRSGRTVARLDRDGFAVPGPGIPAATRRAAREEAWGELRRALARRELGRGDEAVANAAAARDTADRAGDSLFAGQAELLRLQALVVAGRSDEAERAAAPLLGRPELVDLPFQLARALHTAGQLERAVTWYRRALGERADMGLRSHWEATEGLVLALAELGRWSDAESAIEVASRLGFGVVSSDYLRSFLAWRQGRAPSPFALDDWLNTPDLRKYWALEFRLARGEEASTVLRDLAVVRELSSETQGLLLSLESECLAKLGRRAEALAKAREAIARARAERIGPIYARAHLPLLEERLARLAP